MRSLSCGSSSSPVAVAAAAAGAVALSGMLLWNLSFGGKRKEKFVILVTGASSGIGKDAALHLLREGHTVYGAARRVDGMKELVDNGGHALKMDVTDEATIQSGVAQILQEQGKIDILVNNAGYAVYGSVEDITMEDARRQLDVNIFGLARLTKEVLPHMRDQKSGRVINLSSMGGKIYTPFGAWYHLTKHGLEGFSDCLRLELHQFGIQVVIIEPGMIATEFGNVMAKPTIDRSKGGPYESAVTAMFRRFGSTGSPSPPSVVSRMISHAVSAKYPKRRYLGGAMARQLVWTRNWLGDGVYDQIMLGMLK